MTSTAIDLVAASALHPPAEIGRAANFRRWLWPLRRVSSDRRATLLILPHAGGSAQSYASWDSWLPLSLNVFVAQYPGRGARFGEPSANSIEELADALADIALEITGPVLAFGHSLGGLVGFETAWRLEQKGRPLAGFFASASTPPQFFQRSQTSLPPLSDDQLLERLHERGGLPADVLEHPDLLEMLFDVMRADIAIIDSYEMRDPTRRLECPVVVLGGSNDPVATPSKVAQWSARATSNVDVHLLEGGHFYIDRQTSAVGRIVSVSIAAWVPSLPENSVALPPKGESIADR
jgi:pyochelin biosynthetic protein PchC